MKATKYVGTVLIAAMFVVAATAATGCDSVEPDDQFIEDDVEPLPKTVIIEEGPNGEQLVRFRSVIYNDKVANNFRMNNFRLNNFRLNNFRLNNWRLNNFRINSNTINNLMLNLANGALGEDGGDELGAGDVAEADFDNDVEAADERCQFSEIEPVPGKPFQFQRVRCMQLPSGTWEDACKDDSGNPVKAVMLRGMWTAGTRGFNPTDATTWACDGMALAKCVRWGYDTENYPEHHQTCVHTVIADYCGEGMHHTMSGTPLDVFDDIGIMNESDPETGWDIEAAWGENGALCLNQPRRKCWTRAQAVANCSSLPTCDANNNNDLTDDAAYWFANGANIITKNQPLAGPSADGTCAYDYGAE